MEGVPPALSLVGAEGRSIFADGFFDAVISDQVLEHVGDLDGVAREIGRLLKPGGVTYHQFPARRRPVEVHYDLPLVHWLPKGQVRRAAIHALIALGMRGSLPADMPKATKAEVIFKYSCEHTFYRSRDEVARCFASHGIKLDFYSAYGRWIERKSGRMPRAISAAAAANPILIYLLRSFRECRTIGRKLAA